MGFIKILFYLYSKINSFEYFSKVKKWPLFTKPSFNEGLSAKQGLLPFLRYNIKPLPHKIIRRLM